jgi:gliding motility-associated-like protein
MKHFSLFILFLLGFLPAKATHNIAGEITYTCVGGNSYEILVTTYTNSQSQADRWELYVFFGDGDSALVPRSNGPATGPNGTGAGVLLTNFANTRMNEYRVVHAYSPGTYGVYIADPNRVTGIDNIPFSVNVPFYLSSTLVVDPFVGCNTSPRLDMIPLDKACVGACFHHNPSAYDLNGDSLAFKIGPCLDASGMPLAGYSLPDSPQMGGGTMTIDVHTGDIAWCSPQNPGKYNLVIYIEEWRAGLDGERDLIGTVLRDMSIDVMNECDNMNPVIPDLPDLCVDAGTLVNFSFVVTDPDNDNVMPEANGGPFNVTPAATVTPANVFLPTPLNVDFSWQTDCERVRLQPWTVVFKATDDGGPNNTGVVLVDVESVNITVVAPGPVTLSATPLGSVMNLAWSVSPCDPVSNRAVGYKIYRKQGPSNWMPTQCETGVPASTGFVLIATVTGVNTLTYTDNNGGAGLMPGVDYCYRVHTYFLDGAESYASPEACNELLRDVPVITHVDITSTSSSTGTIDVRWANPLANGVDFDTVIHPAPYTLIIQRTDNSFVTNTPNVVGTLSANAFYLLPTLFQDAGLETAAHPYAYKIDFYDSLGYVGSSQSASSVWLSTAPSDNRIVLTWRDTTPWTNTAYAVFRYNTATTLWDSIGFTTAGSFADTNLVNGEEYCYYVKSHGSYANPFLPPLLLNHSQQKCDTPADLTAPCAPVLGVHSDCFIGLNQLLWTNPNFQQCGTDDVVSYNIWYTPVEGQPLTVIAGVPLAGDTIFNFAGLISVAGCYAVTALDTFGNQSTLSNVICVDNCPDYSLPNVFSPNGDGTNDQFIPLPYHYVESIDIKIFDRWGAMVFQTADPAIMWDGRDMNSGKLCTDGVYYYTCTVNEIRLQGIVPRQITGFFHLFGKDVRGE